MLVRAMVPCPKCTRKNGLDRQSCIYCGAALVDEATVARETAAALLPRRHRDGSGVLVAILPGQHTEARVEAAVPLFGCTPFQASQLLRRSVPLLYPCANAMEAAAFEGQLKRADLEYLEIDYRELNNIKNATLIRSIAVKDDALQLAEFDGTKSTCNIDDLDCVVVGRVEVESQKEILESKAHVNSGYEVREMQTSTKLPSYDAFTVFDLYGALSAPARVLETVCTIEGPGYSKARRGAGFSRFARWLVERRPELHVDEEYLQLGKEHRRSELTSGGRILMHGTFRQREVLGTEEQYSGQGFDDYSVIASTVYRLTRDRA